MGLNKEEKEDIKRTIKILRSYLKKSEKRVIKARKTQKKILKKAKKLKGEQFDTIFVSIPTKRTPSDFESMALNMGVTPRKGKKK